MLVPGGSLSGFWVATPQRRVEEKHRVRPRARRSNPRVWPPAGARGCLGLCTPEVLIRGGGAVTTVGVHSGGSEPWQTPVRFPS